MAQETPLQPSELGTRHYWDSLYDRELQNQEEDPSDEGTVWFSESNAEPTIVKKLDQLAEDGLLLRHSTPSASHNLERQTTKRSTPSRFLDLGTGNGHMLFSLLGLHDDEDEDEEDGGSKWTGDLVGVDYSQPSIELARRIAIAKFDGEPPRNLRFEQWDILSDPPGDWVQDGFDVVLDKGTFDAISLMPVEDGSTDQPCDVYRAKVIPLVKPGCFLFITSCNWTRGELISRFVRDDGEMEFYDEAKYPIFTFGGRSGQTVVSILFRRRSRQ